MRKNIFIALFAMVISLCLCFGFTACDSKTPADTGDGGTQTEQPGVEKPNGGQSDSQTTPDSEKPDGGQSGSQTTPGEQKPDGGQGGSQTTPGGEQKPDGGQSGSQTTPGDTPTPHVHSYSSLWSADEENHWHAATCDHNVKQGEAPHTYVNGVCTTCNYAHVNHSFGSYTADDSGHSRTCGICQKTETDSHAYTKGSCTVCKYTHANHNYMYQSLEEEHWQLCLTCGYETQKVPHDKVYVIDPFLHYWECSVCGNRSQKTSHSYEWKMTETEHWQECVCGSIIDKKPHSMSYEHDRETHCQKCIDCQYRTESEQHSFGQWFYYRFPSSKQDGLIRRNCKCGEYEENPLEKLPEQITLDGGFGVSLISVGNNQYAYQIATYNGNASYITLPDSVAINDKYGNQYTVDIVKIREQAFDHCTSLQTVSISEKITSIAARAFNYCTNLQSIYIPINVTKISYWAFYGSMHNSYNPPTAYCEASFRPNGWDTDWDICDRYTYSYAGKTYTDTTRIKIQWGSTMPSKEPSTAKAMLSNCDHDINADCAVERKRWEASTPLYWRKKS